MPTTSLIAEDPGVLSWRLMCALVYRDWPQATELTTRIKGSEDLNFSYTVTAVRQYRSRSLLSQIFRKSHTESGPHSVRGAVRGLRKRPRSIFGMPDE